MYHNHRFEFWNHYKKQTGLIVAHTFSVAVLFSFLCFGFYLNMCLAGSDEQYPNTEAFFTIHSDEGWCGFFVQGFEDQVYNNENKKHMTFIYFCVNLVELIPFLAFYFLDDCHDCFKCLSIDPDRTYSRY